MKETKEEKKLFQMGIVAVSTFTFGALMILCAILRLVKFIIIHTDPQILESVLSVIGFVTCIYIVIVFLISVSCMIYAKINPNAFQLKEKDDDTKEEQ